MDKYPKYIVEDNNLILSKVTFHKDMAIDKEKVVGGGWFDYDNETKTFKFFGDSTDFGKASLEDVKACVKAGNVYTNNRMTHSIADDHNFVYDDNGTDVVIATNTVCPKCGYPKVKKHHEDFKRCEGCDWTSKLKK